MYMISLTVHWQADTFSLIKFPNLSYKEKQSAVLTGVYTKTKEKEE